VVDLSAVTFIDSTAIGVLMAAATALRESGGGSLAVVCAEENDRVLRIFDIADVASVIALYRSAVEALLALAAVRPSDVALWMEQTTRSTVASERSVSSRVAMEWRYAHETASPSERLEAGAGAGLDHSVDELA
jgi:hypothetical protein